MNNPKEELTEEIADETQNLDRYETADLRPSDLTVFID